MEIKKINNLLELFYKQYLTQDKTSVFLQSLKEVEKNILGRMCIQMSLNFLRKYQDI